MVAIEPHRTSIVSRLEREGLDVAGAIANGSLILSDASEALSSLMDDDMPERTRCSTLVGNLVERAAKGIKQEHGRVVFCGGIAPVLLSGGNAEGAIRLEQLWDDITRDYGVHTLCGYVRSTSESIESSPILKRICAVHSAVHGVEY
jgi:MEDS: MEthanogen/methylotroph, DcmR Sensory domain